MRKLFTGYTIRRGEKYRKTIPLSLTNLDSYMFMDILKTFPLIYAIQRVQRDAHDFMRFLFYFWFFAEIADIYFVCFYELLKTRDLLILPAGFLTSVDMPWCEGAAALEC